MKITLNKNKSVFASDVGSSLNIDLSTKARLLPSENVSKTLSLIEQYNKERDNCNKFRLIFAINPICSNVLYNAKTEIVINEGSSAMTVVCDCEDGSVLKEDYALSATNSTSAITYMDAIRNTEYSHPQLGNFTYHCGFDIFNNHMLRNDGFVHVNKDSDVESDKSNYNTIKDSARDGRGEIIKQDIEVLSFGENKTYGKTKMHLYVMDDIISMRTAFYERCEERDGWWGFINPSNINIPNREDEDILTNTLIATKKACDFIDLYPDRSLYSFIPKYNKYRNRLEKNWDYCITYPYENDYEMINTVCGANNYSIRANFIKKFNSNGIEILECSSYFNHNLKIGDAINLYYYYEGNNFIQKFGNVRIENIGDALGNNKNKIFTIKYSDIASIYDSLINTNNSGFYFKKLNGNNECRYYFRKFKKLKNVDGTDLRNEINKIAFGRNIYGDDVAQIIFTDDIDIGDLFDNNNRPVSEVYLTIVKRNSGHNIWYETGIAKDSPKSASTIEYSHCFGKVTSGLDFSGMKDEPFDYNIHKLHNLNMDPNIVKLFRKYDNIEISNNNLTFKGFNIDEDGIEISESIDSNTDSEILRTFTMWGDAVFDTPSVLEDDITIDNDTFYGDVVEYDDTLCQETIISNVYHRVNTAQRETFDKCFKNILEDRIMADDYDIYKKDGVRNANDNFEIRTYYLNNALSAGLEYGSNDAINIMDGKQGLIYGNIMPEGYYYNPHFRIKLKTDDSVVSESPAKHINYNEDKLKVYNSSIVVEYPTDYGFHVNEYVAFFNKDTNDTYWGKIIYINKEKHTIEIEADANMFKYGVLYESDFKGATRIYSIFWATESVPVDANLVFKTKKFTWRRFIPQSELTTKDALYDTTFSNGRLYIEKNINFFLRRQDPFGIYGLSSPKFKKVISEVSCPIDDFILTGDKQEDFTGIMYSYNNFDNCY